MEEQQLIARVYGWVQGVGFRHWTVQQALKLTVTGYVNNRSDGTVEVVAVGRKTELEQLLNLLHKGPSGARVQRVESRWSEPSRRYEGFTIEMH